MSKVQKRGVIPLSAAESCGRSNISPKLKEDYYMVKLGLEALLTKDVPAPQP